MVLVLGRDRRHAARSLPGQGGGGVRLPARSSHMTWMWKVTDS